MVAVTEVFERVAFVSALEVPEHAVIVLKSQMRLSAEQADVLRQQVLAVFPDRQVVVLPPEIDMDVMTA